MTLRQATAYREIVEIIVVNYVLFEAYTMKFKPTNIVENSIPIIQLADIMWWILQTQLTREMEAEESKEKRHCFKLYYF